MTSCKNYLIYWEDAIFLTLNCNNGWYVWIGAVYAGYNIEFVWCTC